MPAVAPRWSRILAIPAIPLLAPACATPRPAPIVLPRAAEVRLLTGQRAIWLRFRDAALVARAARPGTWVFVLLAPGTGRAARVTWNRDALWTEEERRRLAGIEERAEEATPTERAFFRAAMSRPVRAALAGQGFSVEPVPIEEALARYPGPREALSR